MIKNKIKWLLMLLVIPMLASCSWEDLPAYEDADIEGVQFYYRWASSDKDAITGEPVVKEQRLNVSADIDDKACTVTCSITLPEASGAFTEEVRNGVTLDNLVCQVTLSTAARLTPIGNAKPLGVPENWTTEHQYQVMAADGTKRTWTIRVIDLNK